jgi:undecaprenyl pyrophosphate phosphatase UppP
MRRALFRAGVVGVTTAFALLVWGAIFSAVAWGAGIGSREEMSKWTPLVVGPIIAVYIGVVVGLVRGRWRVWRWVPAAVIVTGVVGLIIQTTVEDTARDYEPEDTRWKLFFLAPLFVAGVTLAAELITPKRERHRTSPPS